MRYWVEALRKFIIFAFKPLLHIEAMWGWVDVVMIWLLVIGIIATPTIGIFKEWEHWPFLTILLIAILLLSAGVRLQYRLLRAKFYLKIWGLSYQMLSDPLSQPKEPFKGSTSFELTISNQQDDPRGISKFILEIQFSDGTRKELSPMNLDNETEAETTLYLQPHEPKTMRLNFVYDDRPKHGSEKLYVFDDRGAYCSVPINVDTMITMSRKSESRSGEYLIE